MDAPCRTHDRGQNGLGHPAWCSVFCELSWGPLGLETDLPDVHEFAPRRTPLSPGIRLRTNLETNPDGLPSGGHPWGIQIPLLTDAATSTYARAVLRGGGAGGRTPGFFDPLAPRRGLHPVAASAPPGSPLQEAAGGLGSSFEPHEIPTLGGFLSGASSSCNFPLLAPVLLLLSTRASCLVLSPPRTLPGPSRLRRRRS
jgi:hypothetical protein